MINQQPNIAQLVGAGLNPIIEEASILDSELLAEGAVMRKCVEPKVRVKDLCAPVMRVVAGWEGVPECIFTCLSRIP